MDMGTLEDIPKSIGGIEGLVSVCCDFTSFPLFSYKALGGFTFSGIGSMPYFHFRNCSPVAG